MTISPADAARKRDYFHSYHINTARDPEVDLQAFAHTLERVLSALGHTAAKGASPRRINALKKEHDGELPPELVMLYERIEGADCFAVNYVMRSPLQARDAWRSWRGIFQELTMESLLEWSEHVTHEGVYPVYVSPGWLPLFHDYTGNDVGIDLMPAPGGRWGQIVQFGPDIATTLLATDLHSFFEELLKIANDPVALAALWGIDWER